MLCIIWFKTGIWSVLIGLSGVIWWLDTRVSSDQSRFEQVEEIEAYLRANNLFIDHDAVGYINFCMIVLEVSLLYCILRILFTLVVRCSVTR